MNLRVLSHSVITVPWKSVPNVSLFFNVLERFLSLNNYGLIELHLLKIIYIFYTFLSKSVTVFLIRFEFLRIKDHDCTDSLTPSQWKCEVDIDKFLLSKRSSLYFPNMASQSLLRACQPRAMPYSCIEWKFDDCSLTTTTLIPSTIPNVLPSVCCYHCLQDLRISSWILQDASHQREHNQMGVSSIMVNKQNGRERHVETLKANTVDGIAPVLSDFIRRSR